MNLVKKAKEHFQSNPKDEKYFVTVDGQCFTDPGFAYNHGKVVKNGDIVEISRVEAMGEETEKAWSEMTVKEVEQAVSSIDTVEDLEEAYLQVETKGGKEAIQKRVAELA